MARTVSVRAIKLKYKGTYELVHTTKLPETPPCTHTDARTPERTRSSSAHCCTHPYHSCSHSCTVCYGTQSSCERKITRTQSDKTRPSIWSSSHSRIVPRTGTHRFTPATFELVPSYCGAALSGESFAMSIDVIVLTQSAPSRGVFRRSTPEESRR